LRAATVESLRVRVVDEVPGIGSLLERIVAAEGHAVECVHSGAGATAHLARADVDAVICALRLGDADGIDVDPSCGHGADRLGRRSRTARPT